MPDPVLIVGAGPTGLIMACELLTLGVPCRLIDRLEQPVTTSRSFTIHARTLELLDTLGLVDEFLAHGHKSYAMEYHFQGKDETASLNFRELESLYPFCLIINQSDTEAILRQHFAHLGGVIEWQTKLIHLAQSDDTMAVTLEQADGVQETLQPTWVIGCDGFYSTVRQQLALPFDGEQYAGEMKMMDVEVTGFTLSDDKIYYFINKDHMLLMTRLPGNNYRVLISDTGQGTKTETARSDFQAVLDQHFHGAVTLSEPEWTTVFKTGRRKVDTYRSGRVFLAGDAAHINSPAGGQGMNVSMQDAFNLAWKLAMVMKGQASDALLDTYERERLPIAAQMQAGTQYLQNIIMAHGSGMEERIALTRAPQWNRNAVNQVAGISYTYRTGEATALTSGDRVPNVEYGGGAYFYNLIDRAVPTLVLLLADDSTAEDFAALEALVAEVIRDVTAPLIVRYIVSDALAAEIEPHEDMIIDGPGSIRDRFSAREITRMFVIRPDRHIDFEADSRDSLLAHLQQYYTRAQV